MGEGPEDKAARPHDQGISSQDGGNRSPELSNRQAPRRKLNPGNRRGPAGRQVRPPPGDGGDPSAEGNLARESNARPRTRNAIPSKPGALAASDSPARTNGPETSSSSPRAEKCDKQMCDWHVRFNRIRLEFQQKQQELQKKERELENAEQEHEKKVSAIEEEHEKEIAAVEKEHARRLAVKNKKHKSELGARNEKLEAARAQIRHLRDIEIKRREQAVEAQRVRAAAAAQRRPDRVDSHEARQHEPRMEKPNTAETRKAAGKGKTDRDQPHSAANSTDAREVNQPAERAGENDNHSRPVVRRKPNTTSGRKKALPLPRVDDSEDGE